MHNHELELSPRAFRSLMDTVIQRLTTYLEGMDTHPVELSHTADPDFLKGMIEPAPEQGTSADALLHLIFEKAAVESLNPTSPGFMGYVPGGGLLHAGVADLIASTLNRYVGVAAVAPLFAQIESNVIRWFSEIVGFPETARGTLTSGASLATLSAVVTARHARLGEDFSNGIIYVSDQSHHCITKAALLAGIPRKNIRIIETDAYFRLSPARVEAAIKQDKSNGLTPFMLVGSAGTTNTGAVDPLPALHALAQQHKLWFHVDAAYGGFFCMTKRGKQKLQGIERANSLALDPHKTLFLPYGTGALLVRDGHLLSASHTSTAAYMPPMQDDDVVYDFCTLSPELTRPFRGLRVWLPIKMHGLGVFRAYLDEKLDLAQWITAHIESNPALELIARPELSILAFAVADTGMSLEERNTHTLHLQHRINARNRVNLTGTTIKGLYVIRIAISVFRTHQDRLEVLLEDLKAALEDVVVG